MNLVGSVIGALFFDGAVFNIITVTSLHRAPLSPAGCDFFNCGKAGMRLFNATFLKTRTLGGLSTFGPRQFFFFNSNSLKR